MPAAHRPATPLEAKATRGGRNLPVAIAVGCGLGAITLATLLALPISFAGLACVACAIASWELTRALGAAGRRTYAGLVIGASFVVPGAAYVGGLAGLCFGFFAVAALVLLRSAADRDQASARHTVSLSVFASAYVPLMVGFVMLLLVQPRGSLLVLAYISLVVAADIGGYAAGVLFGKHPMAAGVSPKKTWEGFAGSAVACTVVGVGYAVFAFGAAAWVGAVVAWAVLVAATVGDLAESLIKRDLGIKDMGSVLPGHGGIMERLDSLLVAAPVAYVALAAAFS